MKKLITLILTVLLLFNSVAVFANEIVTTTQDAEIVIEEDFYEEYTQPIPVYEFISNTVTVDGKEYNARQLKYGYDYGYGDFYFEVYVEIAPLAREMGYAVSYEEETDSVIFEKDGIKTQLNISNLEYIQGENAEYIEVISYEDRTYVAYANVEYIIENLYPYYVYSYEYDEEKNYDFYTTEALTAEYKDSFKGLEKIMEMTSKGAYTSDSTSTASLELSAKDLGINVNGDLKIDVSGLFEDGKFRLDVTTDSDGFMNVLDIAMLLSEYSEAEIDFDKNFKFSVIYDGEFVYIKGDLNAIAINSEKPYFVDAEYVLSPELEGLIKEAETGWIKIDEATEFNYSQSPEETVKIIAESTMNYEDKKGILDIISAFSSYISLATKETNKGLSYKFAINKDIVKSLFTLSGVEIPEELKKINAEEFDFTIEESYNNDLSGNSKSSGKLVLSKILPLNENTRIGEVSCTINSESTREQSPQKVTAPEKYTDFKAIEEGFGILWDEYYSTDETDE